MGVKNKTKQNTVTNYNCNYIEANKLMNETITLDRFLDFNTLNGLGLRFFLFTLYVITDAANRLEFCFGDKIKLNKLY